MSKDNTKNKSNYSINQEDEDIKFLITFFFNSKDMYEIQGDEYVYDVDLYGSFGKMILEIRSGQNSRYLKVNRDKVMKDVEQYRIKIIELSDEIKKLTVEFKKLFCFILFSIKYKDDKEVNVSNIINKVFGENVEDIFYFVLNTIKNENTIDILFGNIDKEILAIFNDIYNKFDYSLDILNNKKIYADMKVFTKIIEELEMFINELKDIAIRFNIVIPEDEEKKKRI